MRKPARRRRAIVAEKNPASVTSLQAIKLRNILSFGPETETLELRNLNVLIGPNASGKSNLLDVLSLLRSYPTDPRKTINLGGGVAEWIWKGNPGDPASIDVTVSRPGAPPLRHHFAFRTEQQAFRVQHETIDRGSEEQELGLPPAYYDFRDGRLPLISVRGEEEPVEVIPATFNRDLSILAQRKDPDRYPEMARLSSIYEGIRLYREWPFGRNTRQPQQTDMASKPLEENFSNLGLFLQGLRRRPKARAALLEGLLDIYEGLTEFDVRIEGGTALVFFMEGDFSIPAMRLSDGSFRYLCLLAILHDPEPPPLIGIEEPELGLHPDLLPKLADLLVEASQRTQLIVTTHSDILVDALTEHPESVVICEKHDGCTTMQRLNAHELKPWLAKYRLGQLWSKGELGGNRW